MYAGVPTVPLVQQNVLGLDVAVDDVVAVRVVERVRDLGGDAHSVVDGERVVNRQPVAQRMALHHGHDEIQESIAFAGVVEREDVRMVELRRHPDFPYEPLPT